MSEFLAMRSRLFIGSLVEACAMCKGVHETTLSDHGPGRIDRIRLGKASRSPSSNDLRQVSHLWEVRTLRTSTDRRCAVTHLPRSGNLKDILAVLLVTGIKAGGETDELCCLREAGPPEGGAKGSPHKKRTPHPLKHLFEPEPSSFVTTATVYGEKAKVELCASACSGSGALRELRIVLVRMTRTVPKAELERTTQTVSVSTETVLDPVRITGLSS